MLNYCTWGFITLKILNSTDGRTTPRCNDQHIIKFKFCHILHHNWTLGIDISQNEATLSVFFYTHSTKSSISVNSPIHQTHIFDIMQILHPCLDASITPSNMQNQYQSISFATFFMQDEDYCTHMWTLETVLQDCSIC